MNRPEGEPADAGPGSPGRCLVTGASGFIGGKLAARLARNGWQVKCLVRRTSDTSRLEALDAEIVRGDLQDPGSVAAAVVGCDVVFHCGALVSDWALVDEITAVNVRGTHNVVTAAVSTPVRRFVHFSTTDVYGYRGQEPIDESFDPARFSSWYAQTKRDAESIVWRTHQDKGLSSVVLRPATVYGPGSGEVIGEIAHALRRRNMLLIDGGRSDAGLVYIDNVLDAAVLAAGHAAAPGQAFNVTDGLEVTWRQFTDDLARGLGYPSARFSVPFPVAEAAALATEQSYRLARRVMRVRTRPLLSRQAVHVLGNQQRFDNRKLRTVLGWAPRTDYADGLAATVAWLRSDGG